MRLRHVFPPSTPHSETIRFNRSKKNVSIHPRLPPVVIHAGFCRSHCTLLRMGQDDKFFDSTVQQVVRGRPSSFCKSLLEEQFARAATRLSYNLHPLLLSHLPAAIPRCKCLMSPLMLREAATLRKVYRAPRVLCVRYGRARAT